MRKINVDTDNRLAMTAAVREHLTSSPEDFDLRGYLKKARSEMQKVCEERMEQFGQAGKASGVPIVSLAEMAKRYKKQ